MPGEFPAALSTRTGGTHVRSRAMKARIAFVAVTLALAGCSSNASKAPPTGSSSSGGDSFASVVLNICLAVITLTALGVAWFQYRLQRDTAGGRGIVLAAGPTGARTVIAGKTTDSHTVSVRLVGPGIRHEVALDLERDGRKFEVDDRPAPRRSVTYESQPIDWRFKLSPEDADRVWCVVTWVDPRGPNLRTGAYSMRVRGQDYYQWRWFPGSRYIGLLSEIASRHGPYWFRKRVGRARPLGRWRKRRDPAFREGNGPLGLSVAPGG
jgi:hypothetical protein